MRSHSVVKGVVSGYDESHMVDNETSSRPRERA